MARDFRIYGIDETAAASEIASRVLSGSSKADKNGNDTDSRADSSGGMKSDPYNDAEVQIGARDDAGKNDSRARTEGNHGKQPRG